MLLIGDFKNEVSVFREKINQDISNFIIKGISFNFNFSNNFYVNDNFNNLTNKILYNIYNEYYIENSKILNLHFQGYSKKIYNIIMDLIENKKTFKLLKCCDIFLNENNYLEYILIL